MKGKSVSLTITLPTRTQATLWKSVHFAIVHIPDINIQLMQKFVMFTIKRAIWKFAAMFLITWNHMELKWMNHMELKWTSLMNPLTRVIMSFFIETNNIQNSAHIDHTKNENSDWKLSNSTQECSSCFKNSNQISMSCYPFGNCEEVWFWTQPLSS